MRFLDMISLAGTYAAFSLVGGLCGYVLLVFMTDIRVDKLRDPINKTAIKMGVESGVEAYKKEFEKNLPLVEKKRREKDAALKRFSEKLTRILEQD